MVEIVIEGRTFECSSEHDAAAKIEGAHRAGKSAGWKTFNASLREEAERQRDLDEAYRQEFADEIRIAASPQYGRYGTW